MTPIFCHTKPCPINCLLWRYKDSSIIFVLIKQISSIFDVLLSTATETEFQQEKKWTTRNVFKIPNMLFYFQFKIPRSRTKPDRFCSFWAYERIKQVLYTWPTSNSGSLDSFLMLNNRINFFFQNSKISSKVCSLSLKSTNGMGWWFLRFLRL